MRGMKASPTVDPFEREHETTIHGQHVELNTELTVRGLKGRCLFRALVTNPHNGAQWVELINIPTGAKPKAKAWRSVTIDRVKTVHRVTKTRENEQ